MSDLAADERPPEDGDGPWMTTEEFAAQLKIDPATARNWRRTGYGPPSVPFGGKRRYRRSTVAAWETAVEKAATEKHAELAESRKAS